MGSWGYKPLQNDNALDWLDELAETESVAFVLKSLGTVVKLKSASDIIDCEEALAAAIVVAGARHDPPDNLPVKARRWVTRSGFTPRDKDLSLTIKAIKQIKTQSELLDSWVETGKADAWRNEIDGILKRLEAVSKLPFPQRVPKTKRAYKTIAEIMLEIAPNEQSERRKALAAKLNRLKNPNREVGGKGLNSLTPLHWAACCGLIPEAELLISKGAEVNQRDILGGSPIGFAVKYNHKKMVSLLLSSGAKMEDAFRFAIRFDRLGIVRWLITQGFDPRLDANALHRAAEAGSKKVLSALIELGIPVNAQDEDGDTPLHRAVFNKQIGTTRVLIASGADVNIKNFDGETPKEAATKYGLKRIVNFMR